jgi:hypothetical protein
MLRPSLKGLTVEYFTRRGYEVIDETSKGFQEFSNFDLIVKKHKDFHPIRIKEWNRTVGVNIVISLDKAAQSNTFSNPILVSEKFSEHAKAYANRRGIILITRSEITLSLR